MAMPTTHSDRIDLDLANLAGTFADLEDIAPDWDHEPIHAKMAWYMVWRNDMDILELMHEAYEQRTMDAEQQKSFINLLDWVQRLLPTIRRLELDLPRVPLNTS
jgi:hypothetical protein